jgi:hypothetical protein
MTPLQHSDLLMALISNIISHEEQTKGPAANDSPQNSFSEGCELSGELFHWKMADRPFLKMF